MRILLDTECWLWSLATPERLNEGARGLIVDPANELYLSAASSWEIAIKYGIGKLPLPEPPETYVPSRMLAQGVQSLPIEHTHALGVANLPEHHRDPFDRLLISQAQVEGLSLLTADRIIRKYKVTVIWADRRRPRNS